MLGEVCMTLVFRNLLHFFNSSAYAIQRLLRGKLLTETIFCHSLNLCFDVHAMFTFDATDEDLPLVIVRVLR